MCLGCGLVLRDYTQDLDALLIAKPARFAVEMTQMYQDYVSKPLMQTTSRDNMDDSTAVDDAEDHDWTSTSLFVFQSYYDLKYCF